MNFDQLGLIEPLLAALQDNGYSEPTPIQESTIGAVLDGEDVMASAQTGTGKTAAFTLPLLQLLNESERKRTPRALVVTPTRELAAQVHDSIKSYGKHLNLRTSVVFGGVRIGPQIKTLGKGVDIVVGTPGRLLDLHQQKVLNLKSVEILVLDEADRMLDMGFIPDIKRIQAALPDQKQSLMFSATFSTEIRTLAKTMLQNPVQVDVAPKNTTAENVEQRILSVDKPLKTALLVHLLQEHDQSQSLVFTRTKHGANRLARDLTRSGIRAEAIHGNKSQAHRTRVLEQFKQGRVVTLVATDLASRGLDISELPLVVNHELPHVPEDYVHRIGRTGRAGRPGVAVSLVCGEEVKQLHAIEKLTSQDIEREVVAEFEPEKALPFRKQQRQKTDESSGSRGNRSGRRRRNRRSNKAA